NRRFGGRRLFGSGLVGFGERLFGDRRFGGQRLFGNGLFGFGGRLFGLDGDRRFGGGRLFGNGLVGFGGWLFGDRRFGGGRLGGRCFFLQRHGLGQKLVQVGLVVRPDRAVAVGFGRCLVLVENLVLGGRFAGIESVEKLVPPGEEAINGRARQARLVGNGAERQRRLAIAFDHQACNLDQRRAGLGALAPADPMRPQSRSCAFSPDGQFPPLEGPSLTRANEKMVWERALRLVTERLRIVGKAWGTRPLRPQEPACNGARSPVAWLKPK